MASRTLPGLGLNGFWSLGEDGWKTGMDANLLLLSVMTQAKVISRTTALPGSPSNGDIYIVRSDAGSNANEIAARDNGAWTYIVPVEGDRVYVTDKNIHVVWSGSAWVPQYMLMPIPLAYAGGPPGASDVLGALVTTHDLYIEANATGSYGNVGTDPADGAFDILVKDDGSTIATISISTIGAFTFTTQGGTAKTIAAGSLIEFIAPASPDSAIEYIVATLNARVAV